MNDPKKYEFPKSIDVKVSDFRLSQGKGQIFIMPEKANLPSTSIKFGIRKKYFLQGILDDKNDKVQFRKGSLLPNNVSKLQNTLNKYYGRVGIDFSYAQTNIFDLLKEKHPEYFPDATYNLNFLAVPNKENNEVGFCVFGINMSKEAVNAMKFEKSIKIQAQVANLKPTKKFGDTNGVTYYYDEIEVTDGKNTFKVEVICAYLFFNGTDNQDTLSGGKKKTPEVKSEDTTVINLTKNFGFNKNDIDSNVISKSPEIKKVIDLVKREVDAGHYAEIIIVGFASASKVPTTQFSGNDELAKTRATNAKNALVGFVGDELATYMENGSVIMRSGIKPFKGREWVTGLEYYSSAQWTNPEKYPELEAKIQNFKQKYPDFRIFRDGKYSKLTTKAKNEYKKYQKVKAIILYKISEKTKG